MLTVSYEVAFAWEQKENPKLLIPISHEDRVFGRAHRDICSKTAVTYIQQVA